MVKLFLTGSEGSVGEYFSEMLRHRGVAHIGFDKKDGRDLLDLPQIKSSISGCDAVLHLAVATEGSESQSANPLAENLQGRGRAFEHYLVSANDITTSGRTSLELAKLLHPGITWKNREKYEEAPYRSIICCENAMSDFGWTPKYSWSRYLDLKNAQ